MKKWKSYGQWYKLYTLSLVYEELFCGYLFEVLVCSICKVI